MIILAIAVLAAAASKPWRWLQEEKRERLRREAGPLTRYTTGFRF